ncbi:hypothetical protein V5P93_005863 [Actinokineospora auranticolor]|uniref:Guanylate cyclase domain-containing protein n=1 Tax=Actinokineospora auranticolor TaxID=155976 RepID=A0A2S6GJG7_9PSEU|nr:hypothetical protein [Actinokineospora auranticolor]PPK65355.1 hypothetical protein CLV40_1147 [Actinokineospora auranticolor]
MSDPDAELPPYRGVLVVDAERFGRNTDVNQEHLTFMIPQVVENAFGRAGLADVWDRRLMEHENGDGIGVAFDTHHLPAVVDRVFAALQEILAEQDVRLRARDRGLRLRLRAVLHVGPLLRSGGRTLVNAYRLLDTDVLRGALARSDRDLTFLAVLLSERVYADVVAEGYAKVDARPVDTHNKELDTRAYLHVPVLSGELLDNGLAGGAPAAEAPAGQVPVDAGERYRPVHNEISGGTHHGTTIQVGHVHGGLNQGR